MSEAKLYEFSLCPFCNKVRAGLELKGIKFDSVEVSPRSKKELPELPEGKKKQVPVLQANGDTVSDSTDILNYLESNFDGKMSLRPQTDDAQKRAVEIEAWVDEQFIQALPTVIYGSWKEAAQAARVVADNSKFGPLQRFGVQLAGSLVMHQIAKRILKRNNRKDAHAWVRENVAQFGEWLADQPFVTGEDISMGDVAMHGALTCVKEFPIFGEVMQDEKIATWYGRITSMRRENRVS